MRKIEVDELRRLELDVLDFFVNVCERNDLTYFLSGGTLLGAIRHKGYIPWDDDIDVMMPRVDYEKLIQLFPEHDYFKFIYHGNTHNYPRPYGTINDIRTCKPENFIRKKCKHILGVNIDVFPIDTLPEDKDDIHKYYLKLSKMSKKSFSITYEYGKSKTFWLTVKRTVGIFFYRCMELLNIISIDKMIGQYDKLARMYENHDSKMWGVTTIATYGEKEANIKFDYFPVKKAMFEGKEYCIPANYDAYLSGLYGNYMQLPPKEKRMPHHGACYWRY